MSEKVRNPTRNALILLLIVIFIIIGILGFNLAGNVKAYMLIKDKSEKDVEYDEWGEPSGDFAEANEIMDNVCMASLTAGLIITVLVLISFTLLFSTRYNFGRKHSIKMVVALIILSLAPLFTGIVEFIYEVMYIMDAQYGFVPAISIAFFIIALYLAISEIGGGKFGLIGLIVGVIAVLPPLPLKYDFWDFSYSELNRTCISTMIADVGLMISMVFFIVAIWKSIRYVKELIPQPQKPVKDPTTKNGGGE